MKEVKILIAEYIASLKTKTGISNNGTIAEMSNTAEGTVKNLCTAKVDNPGIIGVSQVIYSMGGSLDEMFNQGKVKDELSEISFISIKEIYAEQFSAIKETNEEHIHNIRSHYEQHHEDLRENYEKRLSDKRELIESYKEQIQNLKKEGKFTKIALCVCIAVFITVLIAEVMNPSLGWVRF